MGHSTDLVLEVLCRVSLGSLETVTDCENQGPRSCSLPPSLRELEEARGAALETMTEFLSWKGQSHRHRVRCELKRWHWSCWGMEQMREADNRRHMN